jgi:hypothetical protein
MKLLSLIALSITFAIASPFPTSGSDGELRSLIIRDMAEDGATLAKACAEDSIGAGYDMQEGARHVKKKYSDRVHDEVKREITSPTINKVTAKRDMERCVCIRFQFTLRLVRS